MQTKTTKGTTPKKTNSGLLYFLNAHKSDVLAFIKAKQIETSLLEQQVNNGKVSLDNVYDQLLISYIEVFYIKSELRGAQTKLDKIKMNYV